MIYTADFETVNEVNDCRVWSWGVSLVDEDPRYFEWGIDIDGFMQWCRLQKSPKIYFHNFKFDSEFIIYWLFKNDYIYVHQSKNMPSKSFHVIKSDLGQMYQMTICEQTGKKGNRITIYDSLKLIPMKIKEMPRAFGFSDEMEKGDIYYNNKSPIKSIISGDSHTLL